MLLGPDFIIIKSVKKTVMCNLKHVIKLIVTGNLIILIAIGSVIVALGASSRLAERR